MRSIPFGKPITGQEELDAVNAVIQSGMMAHGPKVVEFEEKFAEFTGAADAAALSSCTAALHLAYFNWKIGPGDEVIVPAQTHTATAHAAELAGAKAVFVDCELETGNIDIDAIEDKITDRTKAISVVHFLGMPVDMKRVCAIADKYNLKVLEDCALAIGSYCDGIHAGLHGDAGCYSFYPVKHITTAEGGMLISKDADLVKRIRTVRAFGMDKHVGERKIAGLYDMKELGFNYRLNEVQSAMGIVQMTRIKGFLEAREKNHQALTALLQEFDEFSLLQSSNERLKSSYYCHTIILKDSLVEKRFALKDSLKKRGVGTSIYYPQPVPLMSYYQEKYGHSREEFPNASTISYNSIALPVGPHLVEGDVEYIANSLKEALQEVK